jgi:hypothetical protein
MSPQKHHATGRVGGPGASHENRQEPKKSKPHAELPHEDAGSGDRATRVQNKPWDHADEFQTDEFAGRKDAGGDHQRKKPVPPLRKKS